MNELSPAARELLQAARDQLGPDAATVARMRSGIAAAAAKGTAAGAGSGALAAKLGLVTIVAGVAIGAAVYALRSPASAPTQPAAAPSSTAPLAIEPLQAISHVPTCTGACAPPANAPAAHEPREAALPARREVDPKPDVAEPTSRSAAAPVDLAREVELIDRAMTALRDGDPRAALAAVKLHATETRGRGQLAEDAAAIEIDAACRLHDPSVGAKLAAFDERFPTSAQRSRLPTRCD